MKRIAEGFPHEQLVLLPAQSMAQLQQHPIAQAFYPCRIGYFPKAEGHFVHRSEGLDEHLLILCLEGKGYVAVNGKEVCLLAGKLAILPAQSPHRYEADTVSPWTIIWIHFRGQSANNYIRMISSESDFTVVRVSALERLVRQFQSLYNLTQSKWSEAALVALHTHLAMFFSDIALNREQTNKQVIDRVQRIEQVLDFMRTHLHQMISVEDMAAVAHWTPNHLSMVFRKEMNTSLALYFMQMKMASACEKLRSTDLPVAQIAEMLGFEDPYYFSRCFRRCYRMSPLQYRNTE